MVKIKLHKLFINLLLINLWCLHVIEIPLLNRIIVFNKGILNGLKGVIFNGGKLRPNSMLGDNNKLK